MTILSLGTNGFFPSFGRETACYAIPLKKTLIILDAGSGFFRLADKAQKLLENSKEVHIFLSHYHLDHTFGFYAAFELLKEKKVTVFGPSERKVFSELPSLFYFPIDYSLKHKNFYWQKLTGGTHTIFFYKVSVRVQNHRGEISLGFRFHFSDREVAYVTDCQPEKESVEFVRGVRLLLHEHWFPGEELYGKRTQVEDHVIDGHVTTVGTALIARKAKVGKLVLLHHHPFTDNQQLEKQLRFACSIFPQTALAEDLKRIEI